MRFLHTGDWHLGKQIRGLSRQLEFEEVLEEIAGIARDERVDVVLIAGDIYDVFSPPPEAERLFYETATRLVSDGARVVVIAGNHDHAPRMDAMAGLLRIAGVYSLGSVPVQPEDAALAVPSRDGNETATIALLPWVPERRALEFETLMQEPGKALSQYAGSIATVLGCLGQRFSHGNINVVLGHLMIDGAEVGPDGSERKIHIGQAFAVPAQALPATAQYVALGHLHRPQHIAGAAPTSYAGSLLQLDFGEQGQQKVVRIVEAVPGRPAQVRDVALSHGRRLQAVEIALADLEGQRGRYSDDYLKVVVPVEHPQPGLFERVREVLPHAVEVTPRYADTPAVLEAQPSRRGLAPHELFQRFYARQYQAEIPPKLLEVFNELLEKESHATA
jgi:exonuclease SbcD